MKYFISFMGTYSGGKMAAGNTIITTDEPLSDKKKIRLTEKLIQTSKGLDSVAIMSFQEIKQPRKKKEA